MPVQSTIDEIRDLLEHGVFKNEAEVCQGIVNELLRELGWPMRNTTVVCREYSIGDGRVDYALRDRLYVRPIVLIEVKNIGNLDSEAKQQLFSYAFHAGVPILVLTDGKQWQFFYPFGSGDYDARRVCVLDLSDTNTLKNANLLQRYLSYPSVQNKEASEAIESDYRLLSSQRDAAKHLPQTWRSLLEGADEQLIECVAEATERSCGHKPSQQQVLDFLKNLGGPSAFHQRASAPATPKRRKSPRKRLIVVTDNGTEITHETQAAAFVAAIEKAGIENVYALGLKGLIKRKKNGEPPESSDYTSDSSGFYSIRTVDGAENKKRILERIGQRLGIQWKVEVIEG